MTKHYQILAVGRLFAHHFSSLNKEYL